LDRPNPAEFMESIRKSSVIATRAFSNSEVKKIKKLRLNGETYKSIGLRSNRNKSTIWCVINQSKYSNQLLTK